MKYSKHGLHKTGLFFWHIEYFAIKRDAIKGGKVYIIGAFSELLDEGQVMSLFQEVLGHKNAIMTNRYAQENLR